MKIALLGYGRMGQLIEQLALQRGHAIVGVSSRNESLDQQQLRAADVAIEFSVAESAPSLIQAALAAGVPVVSGSTGWDTDDVKRQVEAQGLPAFLHATNMSIGVNALFAANELVARVLAKAEDADASFAVTSSIDETHHVHKLDRPSGTAITLAEGTIAGLPSYMAWSMSEKEGLLPIRSHREGEVFGDHSVHYQTPVDAITLTHQARSREGFAQGALMAAEYLLSQAAGKVYTMRDVLGL